jgi:hypothetical protein
MKEKLFSLLMASRTLSTLASVMPWGKLTRRSRAHQGLDKCMQN